MANPEEKVDGKKQDGMAGDGSSGLCGYIQPDVDLAQSRHGSERRRGTGIASGTAKW